MIGQPFHSGEIESPAQIRDDLHKSAALCEVLCDVFDDRPAGVEFTAGEVGR